MSQRVEKIANSWLDKEIVGQDVTYKKISTSGFPNRIDLTIEDASLNNSKHKLSASIKKIQILSLIYDQKSFISVIKLPIEIKLKNKSLILEGEVIKSSLNFNKTSELKKVVTEAPIFKLYEKNIASWELTDFLFAFDKKVGAETPKYRSHITAANITVPLKYLKFENYKLFIDPVIKKLSFDSTISFTHDASEFPHPNKISAIEDLSIEIDWGVIKSSLKGNLSISKNKLLSGSLEIKMTNWQDFLLFIQDKKLLNEKLLKTIKSALTFVASQKEYRDQAIKVPLNIKNNVIYLGPIKIGKINKKILI